MGLRHVLLAGFSMAAFLASAEAQTPPRPGAAPTSPPVKLNRAPAPPASKSTPMAMSNAAMAAAAAIPHTLAQALAATYANLPSLQAERAKLRATDENVPSALAGWRPTVVLAGTTGYGDGVSRAYSGTFNPGRVLNVQTDRLIGSAQSTITQNLYTGGQTQANVNRSKNQVLAERATLISTEQTGFINAVNAYVGFIQAQQLLALDINNEQVLSKQLQATNDRFRVGEITRTDVAQAEAALQGARATRETAEGSLQTARGTFRQFVGFEPPENLIEPQPLNLPVNNEQEAAALAAANNPNVINALFSTTRRPRTRLTSLLRPCCPRSVCRGRPSSRTTSAAGAPTIPATR